MILIRMRKTIAKLLREDPELLLCALVVEFAEPNNVLLAGNSLASKLKGTAVVKTAKFPLLLKLSTRINSFIKDANATVQNKTVDEFKKRARKWIAAIDVLIRLDNTFRIITDRYMEKIIKKQTQNNTPNASATDTPDADSSNIENSGEVETKQTEEAPKSFGDLLKELGMDLKFRDDLKGALGGDLSKLISSQKALTAAYAKQVGFLRDGSIELFSEAEKNEFVKKINQCTVEEVQELLVAVSPIMVNVLNIKQQLASSKVAAVGRLFGIPEELLGEL